MANKLKELRDKMAAPALLAQSRSQITLNRIYELLSYQFNEEQLNRYGSGTKPEEYRRNAEWYHKVHELMQVKGVIGNPGFIHVGGLGDGGYAMLPISGQCTQAYSFGIGWNVSWDLDVAGRGIQVYMYDHTIDTLPQEHPNFHWKKCGISGSDGKTDLKTLPALLKENHHENSRHMLLKMDVEGFEWDMLETVDPMILKQFDQIVMELHGFDANDKAYRSKIEKGLKVLGSSHRLVHIRANEEREIGYCDGLILPACIEVTYVLTDEYRFYDTVQKYPLKGEELRTGNVPEANLGYWNLY